MMLPLINASRFIAVLVTGKNKEPMIRRIAEHAATPVDSQAAEALPMLGVRPLAGELREPERVLRFDRDHGGVEYVG